MSIALTRGEDKVSPVADAVNPSAHGSAHQTAAIVVVYKHPQGISLTLQRLRAVLDTVLVVDNGEQPCPGLREIAQQLQCGYLHGGNVGGLAGAYNSALRWLRMHQAAAQQVVFLDEDSDPASLSAFLQDSDTRAALAQPHTAAVSPAYRDRATGLRGRYMWLRRFKLGFNPREFSGLREVAFLINSMSVWRLAAISQVGAFNEGLAVDHVDTEFCLRARQQGLHMYVNGSFEFAHAIGERRRYKFFGMEVQAGGHSPQRRYMIGRNTAWLARRWLLREPAFAALCLARLAYEAVGITLAEPQAGAKLWALLRGVASGLFTRMRRQ
jgi:rhamnosyltransferase